MADIKECFIREYVAGDVPAIASLITQLGYPVPAEEMSGRMRILSAMPEYVNFVAEAQGAVVGIVGACMAYHRDVREADSARGRRKVAGQGDWQTPDRGGRNRFYGQGAHLVVVTSSSHRKDSHDFYRHIGYNETGIRLTKKLR
jgi:hypothetical protein